MVFRFSLLSYSQFCYRHCKCINLVKRKNKKSWTIIVLDLIFVSKTAVVLYVGCVVVLHPSPPTVSKLYKSSGVQSIQTLKTQNMGQQRYFASPVFLPFFFLPPPFKKNFLRGCGELGGVSRTSLFIFSLTQSTVNGNEISGPFSSVIKKRNPASYSSSLSLNPQIKKKKRKERKKRHMEHKAVLTKLFSSQQQWTAKTSKVQPTATHTTQLTCQGCGQPEHCWCSWHRSRYTHDTLCRSYNCCGTTCVCLTNKRKINVYEYVHETPFNS